MWAHFVDNSGMMALSSPPKWASCRIAIVEPTHHQICGLAGQSKVHQGNGNYRPYTFEYISSVILIQFTNKFGRMRISKHMKSRKYRYSGT
jgi:hypothetical protein